jgi:hypothetical protein
LPNGHAQRRTGGLYRYARHAMYSGCSSRWPRSRWPLTGPGSLLICSQRLGHDGRRLPGRGHALNPAFPRFSAVIAVPEAQRRRCQPVPRTARRW